MTRRSFLATTAALASAQVPAASWPQWGGPRRNFTSDSTGIKSTWPVGGPKVIWKRPLGEGYSAPSIMDGTLYTMYGTPGKETVVATQAATGKTLWEQTSAVSFHSEAQEQGNGPYTAPLVVGDKLITTGAAGRLQCLDRKSGKPLWTQMLWSDHGGNRLAYGYASSPIAYRDSVIVPVGGKGKATMAFRITDGAVAWAKGGIRNVYSSPILINVDGLEQLVSMMDGLVFGLNPHNGDLQWQIPFQASYGISVATPVWCPGNLLFVSAEYGAGSKMIKLVRNGNQVTASELWTSNRLRLHHGNAMWVEGSLYFTSGGKGSQAILSAVDAATGKIHWQERSIQKATFVWADGKLITLDEDGALMIANPSPKGFDIKAKTQLLTRLSWTPPALVGTKLYVRDRQSLMAVELG